MKPNLKYALLSILLLFTSVLCSAQNFGGNRMTPPPAPGHSNERVNNTRHYTAPRVISEKDFRTILRNVQNASFYENKEREVRLGMSLGMYTSDQCRRLLDGFSFSSDKVNILIMLYPNVIDKEIFFVAVRELSFSSDQDKVFDWILRYYKRH